MTEISYRWMESNEVNLEPEGFHMIMDMEIYLANADGSKQRQLTDNAARDGWASWSPNGEQLVFMSNCTGRWLIYTINADGSNQQMLTTNPEADYEPAWSPDGKYIAYSSQRRSNSEIYMMAIDSGEWDAALTTELANGGELMLMHRDCHSPPGRG